ncbi:MAG: hypothetical protein J6Q51_03650 [Clostridia bacterium]|nr:hypothetical protein [Clostridia bacterium]
MNFEIKNIEDGNLNIIDLKDVCVNSYIKQLFKDNSHTVYVLNDKNFYGAITPKSILNFDTANVIDKNYHILKAENGLNNSEIANVALTNNVFNFPIFINGEIKKEYVITDRPISIFSMNKERWQTLYQNNTKMSNYINSKFTDIAVTGDFAVEVVEYINANCPSIKCVKIDDSYQEFENAIASNMLVLDTDDTIKDLKIKLCNYIKFNKNSNYADYVTLYDLCNAAELMYFKEFSQTKQIQSYFFLFPDVDTFTHLNQQEKYRIAFDKHYRYYYERLEDPEILDLTKRVLVNCIQ